MEWRLKASSKKLHHSEWAKFFCEMIHKVFSLVKTFVKLLPFLPMVALLFSHWHVPEGHIFNKGHSSDSECCLCLRGCCYQQNEIISDFVTWVFYDFYPYVKGIKVGIVAKWDCVIWKFVNRKSVVRRYVSRNKRRGVCNWNAVEAKFHLPQH